MGEEFAAFTAMFSIFGGISLLVWTSTQAKIARMKAEAETHRTMAAPLPTDAVLTELKAMRQQMEQMQSTSHGFDLSFDAALSRLEERVSRVETRGTAPAATPQSEEVQRIGLR